MKTVGLKTLYRKFVPNRAHKSHFAKLIIRSLLLTAVIVMYLLNKTLLIESIYRIGLNTGTYLLLIIWVYFALEMVFRFFPSRSESMGCQKQFMQNFAPDDTCLTLPDAAKSKHARSAAAVGALWIAVAAGIAALFFAGIIDEAVVLIISLFFAVCDIICILFYCPFQSLIMKNRCCVTCRIYNWDFLMMFLPLAFIVSFYTLSLAALALLLLVRWEAAYHRHPQWFCEETNKNLSCAVCTERLCIHKKSIRADEARTLNERRIGIEENA